METPLLNVSSGNDIEQLLLLGADGDYLPPRTLKDVCRVFWIETVKLWALGAPIAVSIVCQFGMMTVTTIFAGHLGDVELSAISISSSVLGTFSFGFMVRLRCPISQFLCVYVYKL